MTRRTTKQPKPQKKTKMTNQNQPIYQAPDELLDKKAAAAFLGVCTRTIEHMAKDGRLTIAKLGSQLFRVKKSELIAMVDRHSSIRE